MTTGLMPIRPDRFPALIGKSYWDIQAFPIFGGWRPVVKGRMVDDWQDLKGIPLDQAIIDDFISDQGESFLTTHAGVPVPDALDSRSKDGESREAKQRAVQILKSQYDKLAKLVKTKEARGLGIHSIQSALKVAIDNLIEDIEDEKDKPPCKTI